MTALLEIESLTHRFSRAGVGDVVALDHVDLTLPQGEILGVVGESGSGKTTLGRLVLGLIRPTEGAIRFEGSDLATMSARELRRLRPRLQIVFQDPFASLNPRMTIGQLVGEPLKLFTDLTASQRRDRVRELLALAQLPNARLDAYPHEMSGGQLQRVNIARALANSPSLLVLDEPTASLDAHTRRSVLDLLLTLKAELGLTYVLISHDLGSVSRYCDRIVVLYRGHVVEECAAREIADGGLHPYTNKLMAARLGLDVHDADRRRFWTKVGAADTETAPSGGQCIYSPRCPLVIDACRTSAPPLDASLGHPVACLRAHEIAGGLAARHKEETT